MLVSAWGRVETDAQVRAVDFPCSSERPSTCEGQIVKDREDEGSQRNRRDLQNARALVRSVNFMVKPNGRLVRVSFAPCGSFHIPPIEQVVFLCPSYSLRSWEISSWGVLHAYMHSAFITTELGYPAVPRA